MGALLCSALLPGCLFHVKKDSDSTGRPISSSTMERVEPGASKEFVAGLFGPPTAKADSGEGREVWRWYYRRSTNRTGAFLFVFALDKHEEDTATVFVEFADERVVEVWRDEG